MQAPKLGCSTQTMEALSLGRSTQTQYSCFSLGVIFPYSSLVILILLICIVQMSGLNIYSYVEDADVQFYRTQKAVANRRLWQREWTSSTGYPDPTSKRSSREARIHWI